MVDDAWKMGSPFSLTSHHSEQVPDPPWFLKPQLPNMPAITTVNQHGQTIKLPYMWYALMDKEPMLLGTDRKDREVYREYLQAIPMPSMQLHTRVDDLALDKLYTDYPFNWTQQLPHHQPTPFKDDRHCLALLFTSKPLPVGRGESTKLIQHCCFYCRHVGHWNNQCASSHTRCYEVGKCIVPLRH
jgi:hypothetical protein